MYSLSIAKRGALLSIVSFTLFAFASTHIASAQPADPKKDPKADLKKDPQADPKKHPQVDPRKDPKVSGTPNGKGVPTGTPGATNGDKAADTTPINIRLRRLEQRVQALKERAWRAKARVGMLKEAVLGGGVGARATILHKNKMGGSFRLIKLIYALDGIQIFARTSDSGTLPKTMDVLTGPIAPGSHTISVFAIYRGHGYGVFKYLNKYRFRVRSSHTFTAAEGKDTRIEVIGFERGGPTTPLEKRPAVDFKVIQSRGGVK